MHDGVDEVIGRADRAMYVAKRSGDAVIAAPELAHTEPVRLTGRPAAALALSVPREATPTATGTP
jgi:hypothetical protein